jgi:uncharacterized membrane protein
MVSDMFSYNISKTADNKVFKDTCKQIERHNVDLSSEKLLVDVDGSVIQIYADGDKKIKVYNDYEVDAVYINSDISLDNLFRAS